MNTTAGRGRFSYLNTYKHQTTTEEKDKKNPASTGAKVLLFFKEPKDRPEKPFSSKNYSPR